jgi:hypothetical protein
MPPDDQDTDRDDQDDKFTYHLGDTEVHVDKSQPPLWTPEQADAIIKSIREHAAKAKADKAAEDIPYLDEGVETGDDRDGMTAPEKP